MNLEKVLELIPALVTTWGTRMVGVFVALTLAWIIAGWARRSVIKTVERKSFDPSVGRFLANLVRYAILTSAIIGCLGVFGIQTASFAALFAAAGLAIGLAFQGTLSNFAAGFMLLVFRPFKVGDVVKVGGGVGVVKEIDLFTSELTTFDNRRIIIPNSKIYGEVIENVTHYDTRRVDVAVGTSYSANLDETRKILEAAANKVEGVLTDPPFQIFLSELGGSSIAWVIRLWCKTEDYWDVHQNAVNHIKAELDRAGISIPFPQLEVHMPEK